MTSRASDMQPAAVARVVCDARRGATARSVKINGGRDFGLGEMVRSRAQVRNDGTYPHKDIGEILVVENDLGCVRESWCFLGEIYYTVEFVDRAVVVIMRGREIASAGRKAA